MNWTTIQTLPWPHRVSYRVVICFVSAGALALLAFTLEFLPLHLGRYVLALQLIALLIGLLATRQLTQRLVLYPLFVAGMLYLWDTTLPPPSLPEGLFRQIVGLVFLLSLLADGFYSWRRSASPPLVRGSFIPLADVARGLQANLPALWPAINQEHFAWAILTLLLGGALYLAGQLYAEPLGTLISGPLLVVGLIWLAVCCLARR